MKISPKRSKILILIVVILLILSLNFFQKEVKSFFYFISAPIQKTLWGAGDRVSDFFETFAEIKNLKKENEELKLSIQELLAESSSLLEFKKENQVLREALEIGLEKDFKLELAEVVGKDIEQDVIFVNKGFQNGLSENLPVITQQKVVLGRITEVYEHYSKVMLISHKASSFDGKIAESDIFGVVKGRGNAEVYLDFLPQEENIKEGELVVSSSLGGIYPEGLLIGLLKEVQRSDISPFQKAEISPFFNISDLNRVFFILNFQPR